MTEQTYEETAIAVAAWRERASFEAPDLLLLAGRRWMNDHGPCPLHGLVSADHRCRDYDGEVFGPDGYCPQGHEAARRFLVKAGE